MRLKEKDAGIELARIICCLFVIFMHTDGMIPRMVEGKAMALPVFLECISRPAVGVFFLITGFLFYGEKPVMDYFKRFLVGILVPTVGYVLVSNLLLPFLLNRFLGMQLPAIEAGVVVKALVSGHSSDLLYGIHLWYIYELGKLYLCIPLLSLICRETKEADKARIYLLVLGFLAMVLAESLEILFGKQSVLDIADYFPFSIYILYFLVGYTLKRYINQNRAKSASGQKRFVRPMWLLIGYLFFACLLFDCEMYFDYAAEGGPDYRFYSYRSVIIFFMAICLLLGCHNIKFRSAAAKRLVLFLGKYSFYIYLLHVFMLPVVDKLLKGVRNMIPVFIYPFVLLAAIFVTTLLPAVAVGWSYEKICLRTQNMVK